MRNYIILNGTNSNTITGLLIQSLAPISKPLMRTEIEEIDGRDGDIITPLGFSAYDKQITIGLYGTYDINAIIAFFNSEGTVTFSNEPDKYYNYQIYDQIDFERLVRFRTATVTLHCQPFKFATTGETVSFGDGSTVSGTGTDIVLEGSSLAPFNQFDLKSNTVQDGTPTPSAPVPVKAVTGLNRVKINGKNMLTFGGENISGTSNGVTYNYNATTQEWTFDGTASARTTINYPTDAETTMRLKSGVRYTATGFYLGGTINGTVSMFQQDSTHGWNGISLNMTSASTTSASTTPAADLTLADSHIIRIESGTVLSNFKIKYQVEASQNATDWEAYQGQIYEVNLGKNLFDKSTVTLNYRFGGDGALYADNTCAASDYIPIKASTKYTYSRGASGSSAACICYYDSSKTFISRTMPIIGQTATSGSVTSPSGAAYARIADLKTLLDSMQLELGGSATSYSAYFTPITLCTFDGLEDKIYKSGDKWYLHKEIGVADLSAFTYTVVVSILRRTTDITDMKYVASNTQVGKALADNYIVRQGSGMSSQSLAGYMAVDTAAFAVNVGTSDTSVNPTGMLYYELATPTNTEITNSELVGQLDAIANQAHAYKTRTNITSLAGTANVPHIIAAEVVTASADGTVTNAGNIYSKPKLTVYGSGDIGIYLNGVQMFQIALGSDGYITIDTNLMEAYKDNLQTLKNRQVTGDYSNFKLPVGQSTISFSGIVTSCVVENFSRWL